MPLGLGALLIAGCGRVIIDDEGEVDSSSAAGPDSGGPLAGSGGASGSGSSEAAPSAVGAGGGGGGSGEGGGDRCASLGWEHEPDLVDQEFLEAWERWSVVDGARLADRDGDVHVLQSGRTEVLFEEDWQPPAGARGIHWARLDDAWDGRPTLVENGWLRWSRLAARPWLAAVPGIGEVRWQLAVETPGDPRDPEDLGPAWLPGVTAPEQSYAMYPLPGAVQGVRDFVRLTKVGPLGSMHLAVVTGEDRLVAWVGEHNDFESIDLSACGDRELPVDVELIEDAVAVAYGSAPVGCGAPTRVRVATITSGALAVTAEVDLGAPVRDLKLVEGGGGRWLVARGEDEERVTLLRLDEAFAIEHRAELPLAAERAWAATTWSTGLVLVDTGPADATAPWIRVRALDRDGAVRVASTTPPWELQAEGTPAALGSADDDAVLVTFVERTAAGLVRHGVVRADCVAE